MVLQSKGFLSTALVEHRGGYAWLMEKRGQKQQKQACKQLGYSAKSGEILDRAPFDIYKYIILSHSITFTRTAAGYR